MKGWWAQRGASSGKSGWAHIADKNSGGVPIVLEQSERDAEEWDDEVDGEEIVVVERAFRPPVQLYRVVDEYGAGDHHRLADL